MWWLGVLAFAWDVPPTNLVTTSAHYPSDVRKKKVWKNFLKINLWKEPGPVLIWRGSNQEYFCYIQWKNQAGSDLVTGWSPCASVHTSVPTRNTQEPLTTHRPRPHQERLGGTEMRPTNLLCLVPTFVQRRWLVTTFNTLSCLVLSGWNPPDSSYISK